jgi:hypothetical protein
MEALEFVLGGVHWQSNSDKIINDQTSKLMSYLSYLTALAKHSPIWTKHNNLKTAHLGGVT